MIAMNALILSVCSCSLLCGMAVRMKVPQASSFNYRHKFWDVTRDMRRSVGRTARSIELFRI